MGKGMDGSEPLRVSKRKWWLFVGVFFLVNLFLSAYFIDIWSTANPVSRALPVLTFAENGTLRIDDYAGMTEDMIKVGDHYYSDKAPLPTLILIPFYGALRAAGLGSFGEHALERFPIHYLHSYGDEDIRQFAFARIVPILWLGSLLCGALPFALIVVITFLGISKSSPPLSPIVMAMMALYGSFLFVFSGTYFNHLFAAFLLLLGYIFLREKGYFMAGLYVGLSFLSEFTLGLIIPLWALLIWFREKSPRAACRYLAGTAPALIFILGYNYFITGSPFTMVNAYHVTYTDLSQNYGFHLPSLMALYGLSLSSAMGIFPNLPVLFLAVWYLLKSCRDKGYMAQIATDYLTVFTLVFYLTIASFFTWWGGWSYGPRYLIVLGVLLAYEGVRMIARFQFSKTVFIVATAYGLAGAWLAKATVVFNVPDRVLRAGKFETPLTTLLLPDFAAGRCNANNLPSLIFGVYPRVGVSLWLFFFVTAVVSLSFWYRRLLQNPNSQTHSASTAD